MLERLWENLKALTSKPSLAAHVNINFRILPNSLKKCQGYVTEKIAFSMTKDYFNVNDEDIILQLRMRIVNN